MSTQLLHAALIKAAFEMRPYNPGEMAAYGGLAGSALGAAGGALTGMIGTEAGSKDRRKAMLRRGVIGLLAGGGLGAAAGGMTAAARRNEIVDEMEPVGAAALQMVIHGQLANQKNRGGYEKLLQDPAVLNTPTGVAAREMFSDPLSQMRFRPMTSLRIMAGDNPRMPSNGMLEEFQNAAKKHEASFSDGKALTNKAWDIIKHLKLQPKQ